MTAGVILVRHPPVAEAYRTLCYGSSDVPLSDEGSAQIDSIAAAVSACAAAQGAITQVFHSGLTRCAVAARLIAAQAGLEAVADARLRERDFGAWELRSWDDIHAETGDAMMGMVAAPHSWRPPGGETTCELRDRVMAWYRELPSSGVVVAVTHGGPIAALLGTVQGLPAERWPSLIPAWGTLATLPAPRRG